MKLTDQELIQAFTDAISAVAVALSNQIDANRLTSDLTALAKETESRGHGPSAGLIQEIAATIASRNVS